MKESKYSKEYLDNKVCELTDEQIEGVAGGEMPHPCLECKHYESLQQSILRGFASADEASRFKELIIGSLASADEANRLTMKITDSLTSADADSGTKE